MPEHHLTRHSLRLAVDTDSGTLSLQIDGVALSGRCRVTFSTGVRARTARGEHIDEVITEPIQDAHGSGQRLIARFAPEQAGLRLTWDAAVYDDHPFAALRVGVTNDGSQTVGLHALSPLVTDLLYMGGKPLDGWVNGFHSWSFSGYVQHSQRQPRMITGIVTRPQAENPTTRLSWQQGVYVGEWVGALIERKRQALIAGFMGLEDMFGQVHMDGRKDRQSLRLENTADGVALAPGETRWGEWAILYRVDLPHADPIAVYAEAAARLTPPRVPDPPPLPGWSSWYQFFANVTADDMVRNQRALRDLRERLPLGLVQLDDGYQPAWGDWLEHNAKFPQGVGAWAEGVRADGFEPGLWLSPFTVDPKARIFREEPEAVLRNRLGRPVHGGFLINRWIKGLDPTHPATQDFLRETFETIVHEWGIHYLKLDYLYCGALPGRRYDPTRTRAQALRDGLRLIRETVGDDIVVLGCGCPLGPAVGLVDILRVSPDVAPEWTPEVFGVGWPFRRDFSLSAARNSISGTLNRVWTQRRWWWLDADNLPVREQQKLTPDEVRTLAAVVGLTGSHLIVSDDLPAISDERLGWAASLLPMLDGQSEVQNVLTAAMPDRLVRRYGSPAGQHATVALINWSDRPAELSAPIEPLGFRPGQQVIVCDFWKKSASIQGGPLVESGVVPPHGVALLSLRSLQTVPQLAGSDLHVSMGAEVSAWQVGEEAIRFTIALGRKAEGSVWLHLPTPPASATCSGEPATIAPTSTPEIYMLRVAVDGNAEIVVNL